MENKFFNINNFKGIINFQEFYLFKDSNIYKIFIAKNEKEILIKSSNYFIVLNSNNIYDDLINAFEENKVFIRDIKIKKTIKLIFYIHEKENEIILSYINNENKNFNIIMNEINILKNDIKNLKEENNKLKTEINKLKKYHDDKNPKNFQLLSNLSYDSYADDNSDNSFTAFTSIRNLLYIIYSNKANSIISYNLNSLKIHTVINNAHSTFITHFRHYLDEKNKRDVIMSISYRDSNIKLWDFKNWECFVNLININTKGCIYAACFFKDNNNSYIATSNCNWNEECEKIKIYDFEGNKIKEINDSNDKTFFMDSFYDKNLSNNYFLTGNYSYIKSYDYNKNGLYHIYSENDNKCHLSIIVKTFEKNNNIIESSTDGNIRIWNLHTGLLIGKIKISPDYLRGICLFDNDYLLVSCDDHTIKIIELKNGLIIKDLIGHDNRVLTIKKLVHPQFGECIISQGFQDDQIKLWTNFKENDIKYTI